MNGMTYECMCFNIYSWIFWAQLVIESMKNGNERQDWGAWWCKSQSHSTVSREMEDIFATQMYLLLISPLCWLTVPVCKWPDLKHSQTFVQMPNWGELITHTWCYRGCQGDKIRQAQGQWGNWAACVSVWCQNRAGQWMEACCCCVKLTEGVSAPRCTSLISDARWRTKLFPDALCC